MKKHLVKLLYAVLVIFACAAMPACSNDDDGGDIKGSKLEGIWMENHSEPIFINFKKNGTAVSYDFWKSVGDWYYDTWTSKIYFDEATGIIASTEDGEVYFSKVEFEGKNTMRAYDIETEDEIVAADLKKAINELFASDYTIDSYYTVFTRSSESELKQWINKSTRDDEEDD